MQRTITPFRITIILGDSSPVAQVENMERITEDDGTVISASSLPAESLEFPLSESILGAVNAAALARIAELESEIETLKSAPEPEQITIKAWQAKAILEAQGLIADAEQVLAAMPDGIRKIAVQSAWRNNADFPRNSETILTLAAAIGLTESQVDEMFAAGAGLAV